MECERDDAPRPFRTAGATFSACGFGKMAPQQLGPYRLLRLIGRGGMGTVHAAENVDSGEPAAVKILAAAWSRDEGLRARFQAEIETLKQLRHDGIVRIFGFGESGESLYYAMELVEGRNLEDELRSGRRFSWREVVDLGVQLAKAIRCAHDHGVTHRDLKPSNLLLDGDGRVKLADFGIARLFGRESITSVGGVLGTAEYMAPEQVDGRPAGPLADLYSLGGVLYALLCGRPPFTADSLPQVLHLQRYAAPEAVRRLRPDCPAVLEQIILSLLEKDPAQRPQNAFVVQRRLESVAESVSAEEQQEFTLQEPRPVEIDEPGPLAETRFHEAGRTRRRPGGESGWTDADSGDRTRATPALRGEEGSAAEAFTAVRADDEPPSRLDEIRRIAAQPQTWWLVAAAAVLAGFIYWASRPISADQLYRRLEAVRQTGEAAGLLAESGAINDFLTRFADDPRAEEVRTWSVAADHERLRRRLRRGRRGDAETSESALVEEAFLSAEAYAEIDPQESAARFRALLDAFDDGDATPEDYRDYIVLARQRREELEPTGDASLADRQAALAARIADARELAAQRPDRAEQILKGVIQLFQNAPWAGDQIKQAEEILRRWRHGELESASGGDSG